MTTLLQDANAPIPHIFEYVGWDWAAWVVRVGALMGLTARSVVREGRHVSRLFLFTYVHA